MYHSGELLDPIGGAAQAIIRAQDEITKRKIEGNAIIDADKEREAKKLGEMNIWERMRYKSNKKSTSRAREAF